MQRLLTLFLLTVLTGPLAQAQLDPAAKNTVDQAAFGLTKATVEFVATDAKTYGNRTLTVCATCRTYPDLIQFTVDNKLTKADELVRDAQKKVIALTTPAATVDQILTGLRQYLHDRVTTGDKSNRLTLPSYKTYTTQVAGVLSKAGVESGDLTTAQTTPVTDDELAGAPADTMDMETPIPTGSSVTKADSGLFSYGGLALLLSLVDLAGLVLLWRQKGQKTTGPSLSDTKLDEVSRRLLILEKERKELINRIAQLEKKANPVAEKPTPDTQRTDAAAPKTVAPQAASPANRATQPVQPVIPHPTPTPLPDASSPQLSAQSQGVPSNQLRRRDAILYGRTADLGDGFSTGSLLPAPDRDTVFQIEVRTDFQAVYRITEEPGAQQLALSDPYSYLADACEYLAKPIPNARIRTDQPGQLSLQGDKWKIVEKAKISFY